VEGGLVEVDVEGLAGALVLALAENVCVPIVIIVRFMNEVFLVITKNVRSVGHR